MNVSSGTGSIGLSRTKSIERETVSCVCVCVYVIGRQEGHRPLKTEWWGAGA